VKRSKHVVTTRPDPAAGRPQDLVKRQFTADAPRRFSVAIITYVRTGRALPPSRSSPTRTHAGSPGWNVASTVPADILPLQALDMAAREAGGAPPARQADPLRPGINWHEPGNSAVVRYCLEERP
jgi:putative transposase